MGGQETGKVKILNSWLAKDLKDTIILVRIGLKALSELNDGICWIYVNIVDIKSRTFLGRISSY